MVIKWFEGESKINHEGPCGGGSSGLKVKLLNGPRGSERLCTDETEGEGYVAQTSYECWLRNQSLGVGATRRTEF